jgi:hypothetical protein
VIRRASASRSSAALPSYVSAEYVRPNFGVRARTGRLRHDDAPDRQKIDRDEVFLEYTKSICPVCKTVIDAEVNAKDNRVFLRKRCAEHGQFEALLYSDAEIYFDSLRFNKPGTIPLETQTPTSATTRSP